MNIKVKMTKPEEIKSKPRGRLKLRGFRSNLGEQFSVFLYKNENNEGESYFNVSHIM